MRRIFTRPLTAKTDSGSNAAGPKRAEVAPQRRRRRYRRTLGGTTDSRQSARERVYKRVDSHDQNRRPILESDF